MPPTISEILAQVQPLVPSLVQRRLILGTPLLPLALMLVSAVLDAALIYLAVLCAWRSLAFLALIALSNLSTPKFVEWLTSQPSV
jgi:hypothetical protein